MPPDHLAEIWTRIQAELRREVSDGTYELWLAPLRPAALDGALLRVEVPASIRGWVADRFAALLDRAAVAVLGPAGRVSLAGGERPPASAGGGSEPPPPGAERGVLNPRLTFEQFIVGGGNRFAHAAALAVAELPGQAYNPLFLCGPPGVGKTHLLHSIGNYVQAYGAGLVVRATTAEAFTNAFLAALHGNGVERFKRRFRGVDVLLVDDVQFLQSKARTEEEFFHTFNALHDCGSQVVLTSDRLPGDLGALEDRLRERFESGLVADIRPPDRATRLTVLRKRVHHDRVEVDDDAAIEVIADRIAGNMRALEGALVRVVAYHSLTGRPIDAALATEVLDGLYPGGRRHAGRVPSVDDVQRATCEAFGITCEELLSPSRVARVAWPRQVAMYLARRHTGQSLPAIAGAFGGRNHTTVIHACRRAAERVEAEPETADMIRALSERIDADRGG